MPAPGSRANKLMGSSTYPPLPTPFDGSLHCVQAVHFHILKSTGRLRRRHRTQHSAAGLRAAALPGRRQCRVSTPRPLRSALLGRREGRSVRPAAGCSDAGRSGMASASLGSRLQAVIMSEPAAVRQGALVADLLPAGRWSLPCRRPARDLPATGLPCLHPCCSGPSRTWSAFSYPVSAAAAVGAPACPGATARPLARMPPRPTCRRAHAPYPPALLTPPLPSSPVRDPQPSS